MSGVLATQDTPLILHFHIWSYNDAGRSFKDNSALAQSFSEAGTGPWVVQKPEHPITSPVNAKDTFSPIEVFFSYSPSPLPIDESFRILWKETIPPVINRFFFGRPQPSHMSLHPYNPDLSFHVMRCFTRITFLDSMSTNSTVDSRPTLSKPDSSDILRIGGAMIQPALIIAETWARRDKLSSGQVDPAKFLEDFLEKIAKTGSLDYLKEQYGGNEQSSNPVMTQEVKEAWDSTAVAFVSLASLAHDMRSHFEEVQCQVGSGQPTDVSNQQLRVWLEKMNSITVHFRKFQTETVTLNRLIEKRIGEITNRARLSQGLISTVGAACLGVSYSADAGLVVALAASAVVGCVCTFSSIQRNKNGDAKKHETVTRLETVMGDFVTIMERAKLAFAIMYCQEILKMPVELMNPDERKENLTALGVDTQSIDIIQKPEQFATVMQDFCTQYDKLEKARKAVARDLCMEEGRLGSSAEPKQD